MALPLLRLISLLLYLHQNAIVSATTSIPFFIDSACKDLSITVKTDTNIGSGECQEVNNGTNSVSLEYVDNGCGVTVYSDTFCSENPILAQTGNCTSKTIRSYSVDCPEINGENPGNYTTISATTGESSTQSSATPSSTFSSPGQLSSSIVTSSPSLSSTTSKSPQTSSSPSTESSSGLHFPTSSSLSSASASPTGEKSHSGGGLSHGGEIGIATALAVGSLVLIGAVVFIYLKRKREPHTSGSQDYVQFPDQDSQELRVLHTPDPGGPPNGEMQEPGRHSYANSAFPSLPGERQGSL